MENNELLKRIGKNLRYRRKKLNLTAKYISEETGYSISTIYHMERGILNNFVLWYKYMEVLKNEESRTS